MDRNSAIELIKNTFENLFDKESFKHFTRNLLNHIEESSFTYRGAYIPDAYKSHFSTLERIGKYKDPEGNKIDLLITYLKKETTLERARATQRNFIGWYLKGSRGGDLKDAALVAFVSPTEEDWRFSLVKIDYKLVETESGPAKAKEEFTPARRFSFLVGKNETSHTAQSKLVPILQDDIRDPTLKRIEEAFSIEKVTKEFFLKYRELFIKVKEALDEILKKDNAIKKDFSEKNVDPVNFAKKLLGQIVFLYFLQKKGWFGVPRGKDWGEGDKKFLRNLFDISKKENRNYFNKFLEPLFYEALRLERPKDYYDQFNCRIPFLNGGLFDPINDYDWQDTDIEIPNEIFSNKCKTKEGDIGNGILDIFDRYNFTVKEDEPLEKEVAIDPELLGKAYEKFNAIRPDNYEEYAKALKSGKKGEENKFNKQFGVYYTPREIVYYMCQQSLICYLHTELNQTTASYEKIGDQQTDMIGDQGKKGQMDLSVKHTTGEEIPKGDIETFIKHGEQVGENEATVVAKGRETDTYFHKIPQSIIENAKLIDDKLANIKVCDPAVGSGAFLVGMMGEIVKARNVLSVFIKDPNRTVYSFKRDCIENSLYGVDIDPGAVEIAKLRLWLSLVVDEEDIKQIRPLPNLDYKIVCGNSLLGFPDEVVKNVEIEKEIEELKQHYFNETNVKIKRELKAKIDTKFRKLVEEAKQYSTRVQDVTFDFEVYFSEVFHEKGGFDVVIANPPYGTSFESNHKKYLKDVFNYITERIPNSFLYFIGKGFELTRKFVGSLFYIIPNEFLFQVYMTKARRYFLKNADLIFAINVGEEVFDAIVPTCIIALQNRKPSSDFLNLYDLRDVGALKVLSDLRVGDQPIPRSNILNAPNSTFSFDTKNLELRMKMLNAGKPFEEYCIDIANGISTGYDEVYIVNEEDCKKHSFEKEFLRPCIRGGQFNRYYCPKDTGDRLLYITSETKLPKNSNIYKYLIRHKDDLISKSIEKKNGIRKWYVLFRSRYPDLFTVPKIIVRQTGDSIIATLDDVGYYCIDSVNVIKLKPMYNDDIFYFVALLNSSVVNFYYHEISQEKGRVLAQVKPLRLRQLSISEPSENLEPLILLVDRILAITKDDDYLQNPQKQAKVKMLEREIDQLVYKLYGLTPEEIAIVEGKSDERRE